jgi:sugar phosphate isomerase/epimerase
MLYDPSHYVLQCLDYLDNIDIYRDRIRMFHVKDAEFNPTGRQGVYSGYQSWVDRAGRFRSLGDGQVDFGAIFSKMAANDFDGWAVVEWECCLKHPEDGAREGAQFVADHIIRVTERPSTTSPARHRRRRQPPHARHFLKDGRQTWLSRIPEQRSPPHPPRHGRRRARRLHRRVHRIASRIDDRYELVAGAFSSTPEKSKASAADLGVAPDRAYGDFVEMAKREARLKNGIEAVAIVTPNHMHYPAAREFLKRGIHVICDKPLTSTLADARKLAKAAGQVRRAVRADAQLFRLPDDPAGARDGAERRSRRNPHRADGISAGLAGGEDRGRPAETGRMAHRSETLRPRRGDRRHRHACLPPRQFRHRPEGGNACADLDSFVSKAASSTTTATCCCATPAAPRACCGQARSRPATRTDCGCAIYGTKGGSNGCRPIRTISGIRRSAKRRLITRGGAGAGTPAGRMTRIPAAIPKAIWRASPPSTPRPPKPSARKADGEPLPRRRALSGHQ